MTAAAGRGLVLQSQITDSALPSAHRGWVHLRLWRYRAIGSYLALVTLGTGLPFR